MGLSALLPLSGWLLGATRWIQSIHAAACRSPMRSRPLQPWRPSPALCPIHHADVTFDAFRFCAMTDYGLCYTGRACIGRRVGSTSASMPRPRLRNQACSGLCHDLLLLCCGTLHVEQHLQRTAGELCQLHCFSAM